VAKVSRPTNVVQRAQTQYPKNLKAVSTYFGTIPYGQQQVDSRTADKRLIAMQPQDLAQLAQTDPIGAETARQRLAKLDAKAAASPPPPGDGVYEP
jgi:hypothetical protein